MTNVALQSSAPILLTFRSLHEDARSEYLARGSAADIWKYVELNVLVYYLKKTSCSGLPRKCQILTFRWFVLSSTIEVHQSYSLWQRVSKMLRVSPSDFDGAFGARGSDRNNQV